MKRIVLTLVTTLTLVVLLFGYKTSTMGALTGSETIIASGGESATSSRPRTVTGPAVNTEWGPVQVQITVADSKIAEVQVVRYPDNSGKDQQINSQALPILVNETIRSQSAEIDMVSGATVTSEGYIRSLQAALDEAGL